VWWCWFGWLVFLRCVGVLCWWRFSVGGWGVVGFGGVGVFGVWGWVWGVLLVGCMWGGAVFCVGFFVVGVGWGGGGSLVGGLFVWFWWWGGVVVVGGGYDFWGLGWCGGGGVGVVCLRLGFGVVVLWWCGRWCGVGGVLRGLWVGWWMWLGVCLVLFGGGVVCGV